MDESGKNIVFTPGLENQLVTSYIKNVPFDTALSKLAYANNLSVTKSKDNFYLFEQLDTDFAPAITTNSNNNSSNSNTNSRPNKPQKTRKSNFYFSIADLDKKLLDVDFENTPISSIVYDIGNELGIDMFVATPLENAGNATFKAKNISFDELLTKIFENNKNEGKSKNSHSQNNAEYASVGNVDGYSFKRNDNIYYFGTKNQLTVRSVKLITLMHRSIELLENSANSNGRSTGRLNTGNSYGNNYNNNYGNSSFSNNSGLNNNINENRNNSNFSNQNYQSSSSHSETTISSSILTVVPDEIKQDLDIKIDKELNSFIVNGPTVNVQKFESFIQYIDKAVPVVLIEVMLLETNRSATIETGISAGIGDKPSTTKGTVYPTSDILLGAETINKIINGFNGFGSLNIGNVVPNFNLSLKAMENNGNLKIRSSPRLSTLNGHKAFLSIGETTYYVVTNQNFYGSQIPQASEIKNYQPIDAELSVNIMPLVSGDGQITMEIKVIQSSFNGQKVDKNAPPGINSREFNSIIRVKDQDIVVLGGLEEKVKNDTGTGIPLLSRIPILKWIFSSRKREDSNKKLTVLIKPTVIY